MQGQLKYLKNPKSLLVILKKSAYFGITVPRYAH